jgi:DNA-binding XRE family transcriptional regulator
LDVSRQTVNVIERGKYDRSLPLAFKIAAVFGLAIEEIFAPDWSTALCLLGQEEECQGDDDVNAQQLRPF